MSDPTHPEIDDDARSIAERAESGENEEESYGQGVLDGLVDSRTTQIRPNQAVMLLGKMTSHEVPLRGGLLDVEKLYRLAVTVRPGKETNKPVREREAGSADTVVQAWNRVQNLEPVYIEHLGDPREALQRNFELLLAASGQGAGRALDELNERFAQYMRDGFVHA